MLLLLKKKIWINIKNTIRTDIKYKKKKSLGFFYPFFFRMVWLCLPSSFFFFENTTILRFQFLTPKIY